MVGPMRQGDIDTPLAAAGEDFLCGCLVGWRKRDAPLLWLAAVGNILIIQKVYGNNFVLGHTLYRLLFFFLLLYVLRG